MPDYTVCAALRAKRPLVHCISHIVTANDCANLLLAAGASPMMAEASEEMAEITAISDSTVLNMGTPTAEKYSAARVCIEESKRLGKPVVLDPVGVGASEWRRSGAAALLLHASPDILRVNLAEAEALLGMGANEQGVDSPGRDGRGARISAARSLASRLSTAVLLSGAEDIISDGERVAAVAGGSALMPCITGSGCMLTALTGAFCGALPQEPFLAACAAVAAMGVCGELAEERRLENGTGNATFRNDLIDAVFNLTETQLIKGVRYEIYES